MLNVLGEDNLVISEKKNMFHFCDMCKVSLNSSVSKIVRHLEQKWEKDEKKEFILKFEKGTVNAIEQEKTLFVNELINLITCTFWAMYLKRCWWILKRERLQYMKY